MTVYDPEIPVDIYQLGLIYNIAIKDTGHVDCTMTLHLPLAARLPVPFRARSRTRSPVSTA